MLVILQLAAPYHVWRSVHAFCMKNNTVVMFSESWAWRCIRTCGNWPTLLLMLCLPSRQSAFFLGWLGRRSLVIIWVYVLKKEKGEKTGCWIIHIPYGGRHSRSSQNQSWRLDGIIEHRENGKHFCGSIAWCSHKYVFMALNDLGHRDVWCS